MVWALFGAAIRSYAPYVVLPFAVAVGTVGYLIETNFRQNSKWSSGNPSTLDERSDRQLDVPEDPTQVADLDYKTAMPKTMFDKNQGKKVGFTGRSLQLGETTESKS